VLALLVIARWQSGRYEALAREEMDYLLSDDLDRVTRGAVSLVRTEDRAINQELEGALNVARRLFARAGAPIERAGEAILGPALEGVVRDATELVGAATTIFARANAAGDMVRVATTVRDASGKLAIGTSIRATAPDGSPDPVVSSILGGKAFRGRAFVVDSWYIAAYEPLRDAAGRVAGMLFVGIPQAKAEARLREAIIQTRIGKTGYVYVVAGRGESRGRYIVSQGGLRDGEDIWDVRDVDGRYVARETVEKALFLSPGELATLRYRWQNPGEPEPRWRVVRIAYYQPWDWVVGTSVYEDEVASYRGILTEGRERMTAAMAFGGAIIACLAGAASGAVAFRLSGPLRRIAAAAGELARGSAPARVEVRSRDEIGELAAAFNLMSQKVEDSLATLRASEEKYRGIFQNATEGIFQTTVEGRAVNANPALAKILGYDSAEEAIASIRDLRASIYADGADRDALVERLARDGVVIDFEARLRRRDGSTVWVSINARTEPDEKRRMTHILGLVSDIDARKRADETLRETLREKDILLKEIHHRVKNNLQVIASLVAMQKRTVSDRESLSLYEDFANRVLAMSQVHELLYESTDFARIDFAEYAQALAENLRQTCLESPDEVELEYRVEPVELGLDQAMPCGLFLNEVLSNALRHAFPRPRERKGRVLVELSLAPGGEVELTVSDDGIGLPEQPALDDPRRMGLALIGLLASQLGGRLERSVGNGTSYRLRFAKAEGSGIGRGYAETTR